MTKQATEAELFRQLSRSLKDHVMYVIEDAPRKILYISPSCENIWGETSDALLQNPQLFFEAVVPDDQARLSTIRESLCDGSSAEVTYKVRRSDGEVRWIRDNITAVGDGGSNQKISGIAEDITEYIHRQKSFERKEDQLKKAVSVSKVGFFDWDMPNDLVEFSEQMKQDWDMGARCNIEEAIARIHPNDRERVVNLIQSSIDGRRPYYAEYRLIREDKKIVWIEAQGEVSYDADGTPLRFFGTSIDITERKEKADLYQAITELAPQYVWMSDEKGVITYSNPQFIEFLGVDISELSGSRWIENIHPDEQKRVSEAWQESLEKSTPFEVEYRLRGQKGNYRWFISRATAIFNQDSVEVSRWLGILVDITDRKKAEEEQERIAGVLSSIMKTSNDIIYMKDRQSRMLYCNPITLRFIGKSEDELYGKTDIEFLGPGNGGEEIMITDKRIMDSGRDEIAEEWVTWQDGTRRLYMSHKVPHKDPSGQVIGLLGISRDITALKETQDRLETFFNSLPLFGVFLNAEGVVEFVNDLALDACAASRKQILGKKFWDCEWWAELKAAKNQIRESFKNASLGHDQRFDINYVAREGASSSVRSMDFRMVPVRNANGEVDVVLATGVDITTRLRQAASLRSAKEDAEKANAAKSAFLANMSHEIRTPMTAILGFTELLRSNEFNHAQREDSLIRIEKSGRGLLKLIDDILDISKVEANKFSIENSRISPLEVVTEVVSLLRLQAEHKGLRLSMRFSGSVPQFAHSDAARIRQILINLIGNAIKFTHSGSVDVEVTTEVNEEGHEYLLFFVTDTGIGISEHDAKNLFEPFAQADNSIVRKFGGTGLGLALSKRICKQMGGDLILPRSQVGVGSQFLAKIAAGPFVFEDNSLSSEELLAANPVREKPPSDILLGAQILVVDDVPDNQLLMRHYLEGAGAYVETAVNGLDACTKAMNKPYDILLMDIQMPELDGIGATLKLRSQGYEGVILALTAHAMKEDVERSLSAGCNSHLTKPIDRQNLVSEVAKYFRGS